MGGMLKSSLVETQIILVLTTHMINFRYHAF